MPTIAISQGRVKIAIRRRSIRFESPRQSAGVGTRMSRGGQECSPYLVEDSRMHLMTFTTSSAKVPPQGKASAGKTPITKKQIQILCGVAGAIAVIVGAWFLWQKTRPQMPRMDAPTPVLAKYVMTEHFRQQPFDMQVQFMKQLDARNKRDKKDSNQGKELDKVFADGRITETEYRGALQMAWFGKHLTRVDKYAAGS